MEADDKSSGETDDLNALGPERRESSSPPPPDDESIDASALAALSRAVRPSGPSAAVDGSADDARLDLAKAKASLGPDAGLAGDTLAAEAAPLEHRSGGARTSQGAIAGAAKAWGSAGRRSSSRSGSGVAARWGLPLAVGIGLGAAAVILLTRSPAPPTAAPETTVNAAAASNRELAPRATAAAPVQAAAADGTPAPSATSADGTPPAAPENANTAAGPIQPGGPAAAEGSGAAPQPAAAPSAPNVPTAPNASTGTPAGPSSVKAPAAAAGLPTGAGASKPQSASVAPAKTAPAIKAQPERAAVAGDSEEALAAQAVRTSEGNDLDQMLDNAFDKQKSGAAPGAPRPELLPVAPSRDDVIRAMTVLVPAIRGCAQGQSGMATAGIVVRNDGHVESAQVSGQPFEGTASGRCMEGVVRRARFPRFQQASFRVQFPFSIQ